MERAVLLVEDNDDDVALTLHSLNRSHLSNDVVVARDGREALGYLNSAAEQDDLPVLVLLDLRLPKIDGLSVLRRIREDHRTRDLPVIIMTSSRDDEDRLQSKLYGANAFMVKPGDYDQLVSAVKKLGLYWALSKPPARPESHSAPFGLFYRPAGAVA